MLFYSMMQDNIIRLKNCLASMRETILFQS